MKKKILISLIMVTLLFTACGNSKYSLKDGSELTKQDMKILQSSFDNLSNDEKTELILMSDKMSEEEIVKFKDDLKRLYVEENGEAYSSKEEAEKAYEESFSHDLRKKQGKLTEKEKQEDIAIGAKAEEFNSKVKEYMEAQDAIQNNLNKNLEKKHDGYIIESKVKDADSVNEKITIEANILTTKDITVGQMTSIRNEITEEVDNVIKTNITEINLKLNNEDKGVYTFTKGSGWDKQIQP